MQIALAGQARQGDAHQRFAFARALGQVAHPGAFKTGGGQAGRHFLGDAGFLRRQLRAVAGQVGDGAAQAQAAVGGQTGQQRLPQRRGQARRGQAAQARGVGAEFVGLLVVKGGQRGQCGLLNCFGLCSTQRKPCLRQRLVGY